MRRPRCRWQAGHGKALSCANDHFARSALLAVAAVRPCSRPRRSSPLPAACPRTEIAAEGGVSLDIDPERGSRWESTPARPAASTPVPARRGHARPAATPAAPCRPPTRRSRPARQPVNTPAAPATAPATAPGDDPGRGPRPLPAARRGRGQRPRAWRGASQRPRAGGPASAATARESRRRRRGRGRRARAKASASRPSSTSSSGFRGPCGRAWWRSR